MTFSLLELQRLRAAFDQMAEGRPPSRGRARTLRRLAAKLGGAAVPLCARQLSKGAIEAAWAYSLLAHIAREPRPRRRVIEELEGLARRADVCDSAKLRALTLLAEVGEALPEGVATLEDPDDARRRSLEQLAGYLDTADEVARAADTLLDQLDDGELLTFVEDLTVAQPEAAVALVGEMLLRDDLDEAVRGELRRLRAPLCCGPGQAPRRPRRAVGVLLGRHRDGRLLLIASSRHGEERPARWRALCALISPEGPLLDAHYRDDLTRGGVDREMVDPLREQGFVFARLDPGRARDLLARAAHDGRAAGVRLPRAFYLGRDLCGIRDEHLGEFRRRFRAADLGALLSRAMELISDRELEAARPLLESYVARAPEDAEGYASLGLCLLDLGEAELARENLQRAHWLDPQSAMHLWNLASASHRAGRLGACYLALTSYLAAVDTDEGAEDRREIASGFVSGYERLIRLEHPGSDPRAVAHAEAVDSA